MKSAAKRVVSHIVLALVAGLMCLIVARLMDDGASYGYMTERPFLYRMTQVGLGWVLVVLVSTVLGLVVGLSRLPHFVAPVGVALFLTMWWRRVDYLDRASYDACIVLNQCSITQFGNFAVGLAQVGMLALLVVASLASIGYFARRRRLSM
jgi:hypothetical protein